MARKGLTKKQEWKFGIYNVALELQESFNQMEAQTMEGSKYFVNKRVILRFINFRFYFIYKFNYNI